MAERQAVDQYQRLALADVLEKQADWRAVGALGDLNHAHGTLSLKKLTHCSLIEQSGWEDEVLAML